jgi:ribonuclease Z
MDLSLFFAGTAGSAPTAKRGLPALLLRAGGHRILFDCGEGTQRQLLRSIGLPDVDAVFLTHFHVDHWLGLLGMVKTFDLRAREKPLTVYGPAGLKPLMSHLKPILGRTGYPLVFEELEPHEEVRFGDWMIGAFPVKHRVEAFGYLFAEDERPGRFDLAAAQALGIEPGPKYKALQDGETVDGVRPEQVLGDPRAGRRIVISGDTAPCQTVEVLAHRADLLVHEATFTDQELDRARATSHSTARQAAEIARDAEVRLLALVHLSTRYFPRDIRDEARAVFPNTVLPRDFDEIVVPFPERGEPEIRQAAPETEAV